MNNIPTVIFVPRTVDVPPERRHTFIAESRYQNQLSVLRSMSSELMTTDSSSNKKILSSKRKSNDARLRRWSTTGTCTCPTSGSCSPPSLPRRSPEKVVVSVQRRSSLTTLAPIASKGCCMQHGRNNSNGSLHPPKLPIRGPIMHHQ